MNETRDNLIRELRARLPETLPHRMGLAVSGGGDSVALMHLLYQIARSEQISLYVATVDHGLRPESAQEAETVSRQAQALGLPHDTLSWQGWNGKGNLQDQARQARYALLSEWARNNQIEAIALGHTADDQAETFLMRLGRAAGVKGLSAMSAERQRDRVTLLRPMLGLTRQSLRDYMTGAGITWIEDPSNQDSRFDRIKARKALLGLDPLGIDASSLSRVANNLAQANRALAQYTQEAARKMAHVDHGDVRVDRPSFDALPEEIQRRLLVGTMAWIAGSGYPPRQASVDRATAAVCENRATTVGGCLFVPDGQSLWICREFKAVEGIAAMPGCTWDEKWRLTGPLASGAEIRALGEIGLQQLPDWRATGRPRQALAASPGVWQNNTLAAAPLAGFSNGWQANLILGWPEYHSSFLSH